MKYILSTLLALLLVPAIVLGAGAASTVFRDTDGFIRPLNVNDHIRATFFVATSTTATSTFAGAVGVGTSTPTRPLEVANANIEPLIRLDSPLPRIEFYENDRSSGSRVWQMFSTFGVLSFAPASDTGAAGSAAIEFNRSGSTATNIVLPISTLEFGIGSTSPSAMLTVRNINAQPSFIVEDQAADASPFLIDASGNVGIGTSTPGTILDVYGASASTIDAGRFLNGGAGGINMTVGRNMTTGMQFGHYVGSTYNGLVTGASYVAALANSTRLSLNTGGSFPITFHTDDWVERMRIANTTGNVGIGTTNPLVPLQVDTSATGSFVSTAGFYAPNLSAGNVSLFNFGRSGTGGDTAQFRYFVGGVGSPANRLDLGFAGLVEPTAAFTYNGRMGVGTTSPGAIVGVNPLGGAPSLMVGSSTNTHLVVAANGNVGIGLSNPGSQLTVDSSGTIGDGFTVNVSSIADSPQFSLSAGGTQRGAYGLAGFAGAFSGAANTGDTVLRALNGTGNVVIANQQSGDVLFATGASPGSDTEKARLTSGGSFGIGTTTPWRTLSVVGTMSVNGLTLNTGAAAASLCLSAQNEVTRNTDNETCLASSARYKENITSLTSGLDEIMKMNPVSFTYKKSDLTHYGLIAEEVAEINPLLVSVDDEGLPNGIRWTHISALLVETVQEQQKQLESLTGRAAQKAAVQKVQDNWQWIAIAILALIAFSQQIQLVVIRKKLKK